MAHRLMLRFLASFLLVSSCFFFGYAQKETPLNQLTKKEKKAGWVLLFDGKTTNGWRPYKNRAGSGWKVEDGILICQDGNIQGRADLITNEQYADFELVFDWRVGERANSGVIYRATEEFGASYESGPEYQLMDDKGYNNPSPKNQSGSNYDMHAPSTVQLNPQGEFNTSKIVVKGANVQHWLNGVKVVEYNFWTPDWLETKANSKWKNAKGYGMAKAGHIALQDHGGGIAFRNIKLRKL